MRVYVPATVSMLRQLLDDGSLAPINGTAFALTPALREYYRAGNEEELEYAAMSDAARASLRLLATDDISRRVVVAADVDGVRLRPELDAAAVTLAGAVPLRKVVSVHMDTGEAEKAVRAAAEVIDAADLGDDDAEFTVGGAEDHELAWYTPTELPFVLELL
ncbi:MAG: hypothetical protein J2O49_03255 [Sciscionella sp.]|nr:hypothetical protein [Sciscionella sp.]